MGKRAMTDTAKEHKAGSILSCAAELFLAADYHLVTMSAVARKMNISNGILYVYFPTKQTLFLSLLMREYHTRADAMEALLRREKPKTLAALCGVILTDLERQLRNPLYIRLEAIRASILETNVDPERFLSLKLPLYARLRAIAAEMEIPGVITASEILYIFHVQTAMIGGFKLASAIAEPLRGTLLQNGLCEFVHEFRQDTLRTMRLYLQALQAAKGGV